MVPHTRNIIARPAHTLSRKQVDRHALKVLYQLHNAGFDAYLVGGCVRDLLLNLKPKDFDIATNATPNQVKRLFRNCRLIGRRFRLAHIHFGRHIIEVATFRASHKNASDDKGFSRDGLIVRDNVFGSIEEDAWRRDFSVNALYYNIADFSIVDFTNAMQDIQNRQISILGDAETRYREDPVRLLRAIRFAAKLQFDIAPKTAAPIKAMASILEQVPSSRLFDEMIKLFHSGHAARVYTLLEQYGILDILLPSTAEQLKQQPQTTHALLTQAFADTDDRIQQGKTVSIAYLFAVLLWPSVCEQQKECRQADDLSEVQALIQAGFQVIDDQSCATTLPRRFSTAIQEIWHLQYRLERRRPRTIKRCLSSSRFRAAFDLLCLRAKIDTRLQPLVEWWEQAQTTEHTSTTPQA
jgi:poly(A) polymerase